MSGSARVRHVPALAGFALSALLLAGCGSTPPAAPVAADHGTSGAGTSPSYPKAEPPGPLYSLFHRPLKVPDGLVEVMRLHGEGTQIFRCEAQTNGGLHWAYRLPDAELRDAAGAVTVHHGANLSFEHVDGSRLLGEIADHVASPSGNALPWLLMTTRSYGTGALSGVSYVERVDTAGGMPPAACETAQLNQVLRVPFSADFVFLR